MLVVDASACLSYLLEDGDTDWVREHVRTEMLLHAPALIDFELGSAFRMLRDRTVLTAALDAFGMLQLLRYPGRPLLPRVWELRGHLSAYDASYVALAEALELPLLTLDRRLARAGGHGAVVHAP